jgi:ABC-type transporter Mla subunit MlaD
MEAWWMAAVVLAAVLVGVAIPTLVQARSTLRELQRTLRRSGAKLDETLLAAAGAAGRIDRILARLEEKGQIGQLVEGAAAMSRTVSQLQDTLRVASAVGAALGPAVAAAIHAFRDEPEEAAQGPATEVDSVQPEPRKEAVS